MRFCVSVAVLLCLVEPTISHRHQILDSFIPFIGSFRTKEKQKKIRKKELGGEGLDLDLTLLARAHDRTGEEPY